MCRPCSRTITPTSLDLSSTLRSAADLSMAFLGQRSFNEESTATQCTSGSNGDEKRRSNAISRFLRSGYKQGLRTRTFVWRAFGYRDTYNLDVSSEFRRGRKQASVSRCFYAYLVRTAEFIRSSETGIAVDVLSEPLAVKTLVVFSFGTFDLQLLDHLEELTNIDLSRGILHRKRS